MMKQLNPNLYEERRFREGYFDCDICGLPWPRSHVRRQSEKDVGVTCCYEPNGGVLERDIQRSDADVLAADLEAHISVHEEDGVIGTEGLSAVTALTPSVVELAAGGVAVPWVLTGVGFTAADTLDYGTVDVTDAVAPVITSTQITLSLVAAVGSRGDYDFTFNSTPFRGCIRVR